jgi:hypothetical protein
VSKENQSIIWIITMGFFDWLKARLPSDSPPQSHKKRRRDDDEEEEEIEELIAIDII